MGVASNCLIQSLLCAPRAAAVAEADRLGHALLMRVRDGVASALDGVRARGSAAVHDAMDDVGDAVVAVGRALLDSLEQRSGAHRERAGRLRALIEQTLTLDPSAPSCFAQIKLKPTPGVVSRTKPAASPASEPRRPIVLPNGALIPSPATLAPRG